MSPPLSVNRLAWMDVSRGIGIILVVVGHVLRGLESAAIIADDATFRTIDYTIYSFHMPLFFFLSGLNVKHSIDKGRVFFIRHKISTILYPYFLYSILQGGVQVWLSGSTNGKMSVSELSHIAWDPIAQFWFLYALFVCHLVASILPLNATVLLSLSMLTALIFGIPLTRTVPVVGGSLFGFTFYAPGIFIGSRLVNYIKGSWGSVAFFCALFSAAAVVNGLISSLNDRWIGVVPAAWFGTAMVLAVSQLARGRVEGIFAVIGEMSMAIYVLHILAGSGVRILLTKAGIDSPSLHFTIGVSAGIALPMLAHLVLQKAGLLRLAGLGRTPKGRSNPANSTPPSNS